MASFIHHASQILHSALTPYGFLASPIAADNYKRVWARDGIIAGIAGLLLNDEELILGLKKTLLTLHKYKHPITAAIPSNVDVANDEVSFGSLSGRVDASTWFKIGAALYYQKSNDSEFLNIIKPTIAKLNLLICSWEYNGRHLINTPMSGNWADEYPYHGYLLYDNCLYQIASSLWANINNDLQEQEKADDIKKTIQINFWPDTNYHENVYHPILYKKNTLENRNYFMCGFHASGSYVMFDAAGNALALIAGLFDEDKIDKMCRYLDRLWQANTIREGMVPCFWPPIYQGDELYPLLTLNHTYDFKNKPYHFHNGGIWPVWMGLLCGALRLCHKDDVAHRIANAYENILENNGVNFCEYIDSDQYHLQGKSPLVYSASGYIFMNASFTELFNTNVL